MQGLFFRNKLNGVRVRRKTGRTRHSRSDSFSFKVNFWVYLKSQWTSINVKISPRWEIATWYKQLGLFLLKVFDTCNDYKNVWGIACFRYKCLFELCFMARSWRLEGGGEMLACILLSVRTIFYISFTVQINVYEYMATWFMRRIYLFSLILSPHFLLTISNVTHVWKWKL